MTKVDFIGSFMLLQFYDGHHWQMSDEALNRYAVSAGPELGQLMRFWTLMYLAWLFRWCILGVHGAEFEKAMMASFYERMKLAPVKPGEFDIAAAIVYRLSISILRPQLQQKRELLANTRTCSSRTPITRLYVSLRSIREVLGTCATTLRAIFRTR